MNIDDFDECEAPREFISEESVLKAIDICRQAGDFNAAKRILDYCRESESYTRMESFRREVDARQNELLRSILTAC